MRAAIFEKAGLVKVEEVKKPTLQANIDLKFSSHEKK